VGCLCLMYLLRWTHWRLNEWDYTDKLVDTFMTLAKCTRKMYHWKATQAENIGQSNKEKDVPLKGNPGWKHCTVKHGEKCTIERQPRLKTLHSQTRRKMYNWKAAQAENIAQSNKEKDVPLKGNRGWKHCTVKQVQTSQHT